MGVFKKPGVESISLEEQLESLCQIGISPCCDDFTDWILTEWSREQLEADPYNLLLFSLGGEREMDGRWMPVSNDIYCFDTECVEDDDIYAQIFMDLRRISKGEFDISDVTSAVDHDRGKAEVSFTYSGKNYHWDLEYNGDWLDGSIFHNINELIGENADDRMFYISNPDQGVRLIYKSRTQAEKLNILASTPFLDTAYAPGATKASASRSGAARASAPPAPVFRSKQKRETKNSPYKSFEFIGLAGGLLLIAVCCIYQQLAGRAANDTAVNFMLALGFALLIISMVLMAIKQKRSQKTIMPAKPVKMTEEEAAEAMTLLAPTIQPYIGLKPYRRPTGVYDSKFGGAPYLPPDFNYPRNLENNTPLKLLCQLNFELLPRLPGFPERGILQFYIPCDSGDNTDYMYGLDFDNRCEQSRWRVVYHRDIVKDVTLLQGPPELMPESDSLFPFTGEFALEAELSSMPLIYNDYRWVDFRENVWEKSESGQRLAEKYSHYDVELLLDEAVDKDAHKIGGYPQFAQDDPRSYTCDEHTILLLQMGSDLDIMWGDAGFANFFITPEALEKCDFSNIMYNWDCY